jgi:starch phosphorylase
MTSPGTHIPYLPARIEGLTHLAKNLWWSWNREARVLFQTIDPSLWGMTRHNPRYHVHRAGTPAA